MAQRKVKYKLCAAITCPSSSNNEGQQQATQGYEAYAQEWVFKDDGSTCHPWSKYNRQELTVERIGNRRQASEQIGKDALALLYYAYDAVEGKNESRDRVFGKKTFRAS